MINYPQDVISDFDKYQFCNQLFEALRFEHNRKAAQYNKGVMTEKQFADYLNQEQDIGPFQKPTFPDAEKAKIEDVLTQEGVISEEDFRFYQENIFAPKKETVLEELVGLRKKIEETFRTDAKVSDINVDDHIG